jgi:nucleolar GTP-binding protein
VYDFIDPEIDAKLAALEDEEERLEAEGFYNSDEDIEDDEEEEILQKAEIIREKQMLIRNENKMRKSLKNRAMIPRKAIKKSLSQLEDHLDQLGVDTEEMGLRGRAQAQTGRGRSLTRSRMGTEDPDSMDIDSVKSAQDRLRSRSRARSQPATNRREDGVQDVAVRSKAERQAKLGQRKMNRMARQGEADRHIGTAMPKHLVSVGSLHIHPFSVFYRFVTIFLAP